MSQIPEIRTKQLLVCEGLEDLALVNEMIRKNLCIDALCTSIGIPGKGLGINGLQAHLIALSQNPGFKFVREIRVICDNDDDPSGMFSYIRSELISANSRLAQKHRQKLSIPNSAYEKAADSTIKVQVIMLPEAGVPGCLETLLLKALANLYSQKLQCVEDLIGCSQIQQESPPWTSSKIDKARVRSALSVLTKDNPAIALSRLWDEFPDLIPVTDPAFYDLSKHLSAA